MLPPNYNASINLRVVYDPSSRSDIIPGVYAVVTNRHALSHEARSRAFSLKRLELFPGTLFAQLSAPAKVRTERVAFARSCRPNDGGF
jgi:hypothetical protein